MSKVICIFCFNLLLFSAGALGQNAIGLVCTNFTVNGQNREEGKEYRRSVESVLSSLKYPPELIDREKIQDLLVKIQDEVNLNKDLNISEARELKAARVDYLMYGNFDKKLINSSYDLEIECIKISGDNAFSKIAFPILSFTENDLTNTQIFRNRILDMFSKYAFTEDFGIIENSQLNKINIRLDEKDKQIKNLDSTFKNIQTESEQKSEVLKNLSDNVKILENDNLNKDQQIIELNNQIIGVRDYSNIALLDLNGIEKTYSSMFVGWKTELYNLMSSVIGSTPPFFIKTNDTALTTLKEVIQKYPKFPFGYYGMCVNLIKKQDSNWKSYAIKALKILEITTTIDGHKPIHDQVLQLLKELIDDDKEGAKIIITDKGECLILRKHAANKSK